MNDKKTKMAFSPPLGSHNDDYLQMDGKSFIFSLFSKSLWETLPINHKGYFFKFAGKTVGSGSFSGPRRYFLGVLGSPHYFFPLKATTMPFTSFFLRVECA